MLIAILIVLTVIALYAIDNYQNIWIYLNSFFKKEENEINVEGTNWRERWSVPEETIQKIENRVVTKVDIPDDKKVKLE